MPLTFEYLTQKVQLSDVYDIWVSGILMVTVLKIKNYIQTEKACIWSKMSGIKMVRQVM